MLILLSHAGERSPKQMGYTLGRGKEEGGGGGKDEIELYWDKLESLLLYFS